jgi:hypothetical protein
MQIYTFVLKNVLALFYKMALCRKIRSNARYVDQSKVLNRLLPWSIFYSVGYLNDVIEVGHYNYIAHFSHKKHIFIFTFQSFQILRILI